MAVRTGQAIADKGRITIATGAEGDEAWVSIEDTGCGIPQADLNRIFEPFFTTKPVGKGTGLGLSVTYSLVRKHGGSIEVDSEIGRGSRFTVRLPLRQARQSKPPELVAIG